MTTGDTIYTTVLTFNDGEREVAYVDDGTGAVQKVAPYGAFTASGSVALAAGEAHIGAVGGKTVSITVTPTITSGTSYASGDFVGENGAAFEIPGAARINGGSGVIMSATLIDAALQSVAAEAWLFDSAPTPPNDSAAWTITDADALKCIGVIPFSTYYASAANSVSPAQNQNIGFTTGSASTSLYGCTVTRGAPTYTSGSISYRFTIAQD